jgi:peptidoglycan hydrolase-like protein with peptidoglycan-binding domain
LAAGTANVTFSYTSGNTTDSNVAANGTDVLTSVVNGAYTINGSSAGSGSSSAGGGGGGGGGTVTYGGDSGGGGSSSGGGAFSPSAPSGSIGSLGGGGSCAPGLSIALINSVVGRGSSGENVTNLQRFLVEKGYMQASNITGYFGPATEAALKKFQAAENIVSSGDPISTGYGNAGPSTRARINSLIATSIPKGCVVQAPPPGIQVATAILLNRNLSRGSSGSDVTNLQQFLVSKGYTTADNITGFFGPVTEAAIKAFQRAEGIVSSGDPVSTGYGNVGPSTRARINALAGGATAPSLPATAPQSLQAQLDALQKQVQELLLKLQQAQ